MSVQPRGADRPAASISARGLRRLRVIPRGSAGAIVLISLTIAVEAAFRVLLPLLLGFIIEKGADPSILLPVLAVLAGSFVLAVACGVVRDFANSRLQSRAVTGMRQGMFERLQQLSMKFHSRAEGPAILERFTGDSAAIEHALAMCASWGLLPLIESVLATALAFWLDWRIGFVLLITWPWVLLTPRISALRTRVAEKEMREEEARVIGTVDETLRAQQTIRAFSLEQAGVAAFTRRNTALAQRVLRAGLASALGDRLTESGTLFLQALTLAASVWLASQHDLSPGRLVVLQILQFMLGASLLYASEFLPALENAKLAWDRINDGLAESDPVFDKADAKILPAMKSEITFAGVKFAAESAQPVLSGVSLQVKRGRFVAFVGPSGSGKSTMLKLLMRFHDPASGTVAIDGHDLRGVTQKSLRSQLGVVLQDNFIFKASFRENLRVGRADATEEKIVDAARAAGLHDYIASLPEGYATQIGSGGLLVTGENMQRLAIARAVLRGAGILLLDEIASALEPAEEVRINATLAALAADRTVISVSHRLSTTASADEIHYFENGRVLESGGHYELLAANGRYANLWRKQAGFRFSPDGRHVDVDAQRLRQLPMLEKLDDAILADIAPFFATETFPSGREIVLQEDPGDKFYIIVRGKVDVWHTDEDTGNRIHMAVLHDGDFFGEITLITGFPRTATVRTQTVCTCISLERGQFNRLFERNPELLREISQIAVRRLRETTGNASAEIAARVPIV